jgi:DUF4097 and DUF4098 domain-containing protein YvlB
MGAVMTTFETNGPVELTVDLGIRSDIWITATDRQEARVEVRPRNPSRSLDTKAAEQVQVGFDDGRLRLTHRQWRRYISFSDGGAVDVTIEVPIGSTLDASSGMGDIVADGEFGVAVLRSGMGALRIDQCAGLRAKTGMGDVTVGGVAGDVDIATGTGKVRVAEVGGSATIKNSNGETLVGGVARDLHVRAANGDIAIDRTGGDVDAKASNGSLRIGEVSRGTVTIATAAGVIDVGVRPGTATWLDLNSKYGRVHSSLDAADGPAPGGDTLQLRARTAYGDIAVHRSERNDQ